MRENKILKAICVYVKRYVVSTEKTEDIKNMKLISGTNLSYGRLLYGRREGNFLRYVEFMFRINTAD